MPHLHKRIENIIGVDFTAALSSPNAPTEKLVGMSHPKEFGP